MTLTPATHARLLYAEARSAALAELWQAVSGGDTVASPNDAAVRSRPVGRAIDGDLAAMLLRLAETPRQTAPAPLRVPLALPGEKDDDGHPRETPRDRREPAAVPATPPAAAGHGAALRVAAARTGIPVPVIAAIIDAEAAKDASGRWYGLSRNPRSSAAGLGQFLSRTWRGHAEQPGTWLNDLARSRGWLNDRGHVRGEAKAALLALRYDPFASIHATADLARLNLATLRGAGIAVGSDHADLARVAYIAHHLGPRDAIRFLTGRLDPARAGRLLAAQIGEAAARQRIQHSDNATEAHRAWLLRYVAVKVNPAAHRLAYGDVTAT